MSSFTPVIPPTTQMTKKALQESLTRIRHVEGPLQTIPQVIMAALQTHVANGGVDDFSMKLWQSADQGLACHYGREAKFVDRHFGEDIEMSRFAYDNFTQNVGKQIFIAKISNIDVTMKGQCDYCICFGPSGNPHRDGPGVKKGRFKDTREWHTLQWGIWVPTQLRNKTWLLQKESDIVRAFIPGPARVPGQKRGPRKKNVEANLPVNVDPSGITPPRIKAPASTFHDDARNASFLTESILLEQSDEDEVEVRPRSTSGQARNKRDWSSDGDPSEGEKRAVPRRKKLKVTLTYPRRVANRIVQILNNNVKQKIATHPRNSTTPSNSFLRSSQQSPTEHEGIAKAQTQMTDNNSILISDDEAQIRLVKQEAAIPIAQRGRTQNFETQPSQRRHAQSHITRQDSRTDLSTGTTAVTSPPEVKRSGTADIDLKPGNLGEVTFTFKDARDNIVEQLPFEECNSAESLFSQAVACDIADFDTTRMLEVHVGDKGPVRIVKDSKSNFERKVLQPLLATREEFPGFPVEVVVKNFK